MSKSTNAKKKIFDIYSDNLRNYLKYANHEIAIIDGGNFVKVTAKAYRCPLCDDFFSEQDIYESSTHNFLTLEHNPPKVLGGKSSILTCKRCNNKNGTELDNLVHELFEKESFLLNDAGPVITSSLKIDKHQMMASLKKAHGAVFIRPIVKSNPWAYKHLHENISGNKPLKINFNLTVPDWNSYSLGMLKIAYLKAFELFGYHFADLGNGANIREVLTRTMTYPCPNNGVIDIDASSDFLGVHIVKEPKELRSLIITQKIVIKNDEVQIEKNIPVILPIPSEEGWGLLHNFNKYLNGELKISTQKISINQTPFKHSRDYYSLFVS